MSYQRAYRIESGNFGVDILIKNPNTKVDVFSLADEFAGKILSEMQKQNVLQSPEYKKK